MKLMTCGPHLGHSGITIALHLVQQPVHESSCHHTNPGTVRELPCPLQTAMCHMLVSIQLHACKTRTCAWHACILICSGLPVNKPQCDHECSSRSRLPRDSLLPHQCKLSHPCLTVPPITPEQRNSQVVRSCGGGARCPPAPRSSSFQASPWCHPCGATLQGSCTAHADHLLRRGPCGFCAPVFGVLPGCLPPSTCDPVYAKPSKPRMRPAHSAPAMCIQHIDTDVYQMLATGPRTRTAWPGAGTSAPPSQPAH